MNIQPTYVILEQSKLLKEKGFDEKVHQYYQFIKNASSKLDKTWQFIYSSFLVRESDAAMFPDEGKNGIEVSAYSDRIFRDYNFKTSDDFISAPEQYQVVEWLRINHGIWIGVPYLGEIRENSPIKFNAEIRYIRDVPNLIQNINGFNSPQEAYSAAFDYILKELI